MANNKSALKRIKITERNRLENRYYKGTLRYLTKTFLNELEDKHSAKQTLNLIYSILDKGTKKHIWHKNKVARKKSQLALKLK
uniref:ribosomal protein S20 n=1 Tax=Tenuicylindrus belgicus TaxID=1398096 RepID=UPI002238B80F|nr:ribosomal protein S20 [Tenuicylindrus belgicus]UYC31601.1 ribosomal protein S20 [Tenuicylindrus belgicus]